jgi:cell division transport system permease protein
MLPVLVAAMAFLAALAMAGAGGAAALVRHWQEGAASAVTVQVPAPQDKPTGAPEGTRLERAMGVLRVAPGVMQAKALSAAELTELLRPWLGNAGADQSLPLPAVIQVRLAERGGDPAALQSTLEAAVPGVLVESHGVWVQRLAVLARSLQACAWLALIVVAAVAAAVVMVATRAGLVARRESIEIVHGLGARDGYIAGRFAARATSMATIGGLVGALAAVPLLLALASLAAPFVSAPDAAPVTEVAEGVRPAVLAALHTLPLAVWLGLIALPLSAAAIGFSTAQATVRAWLRRLP